MSCHSVGVHCSIMNQVVIEFYRKFKRHGRMMIGMEETLSSEETVL